MSILFVGYTSVHLTLKRGCVMCILFAYATIVSVYTWEIANTVSSCRGKCFKRVILYCMHFDFFFFLVVWCGMRDLSSLTKDLTNTHCSGKGESYPLDCQGSPLLLNFELSEWTFFFFYYMFSLYPRIQYHSWNKGDTQ